MTTVSERMYEFRLAAQWEAGARGNLELRDGRLAVPDQLAIEPVAGAGRREAEALPAVSAGGHLRWLRPSPRVLVRRPPPGSRGVIELGILEGESSARRLLTGHTVIWVLAENGLDRYHAATLQRLTPVEPAADGWRASDAAGDGGDGLWLAEGDPSRGWRLRHVDCWGRSCRAHVDLGRLDAADLALASTPDGGRLVAIDPNRATTGYVVDTVTGAVERRIELDPLHLQGRALLTATAGGRMHLLTDTGAGAVAYQVLSLASGDVEIDQLLDVPDSLGRPTAMAGGPRSLVVAGPCGVGEILPRPGATRPRRSTFITPALVSPLGARSGWSRAEIDVVLPTGTAMDVTCASTDSAWLIRQSADLMNGPVTAHLVDDLEALLPWQDEKTVTCSGTGDSPAGERLAVLLDEVAATTIWLRVRLDTPPGRTPPAVQGLRVRYPDVSYLDDLPAIYREHPQAARELRRILAPYELLFDGLDDALDRLPDRIDPETAGDDWNDYLLRWLGFPPVGDLPARLRRALLRQAADLLTLRGTRAGLQLLLDLVTERRATVTDTAEEPAAWFLGSGDLPSVGAGPARLGADTIAVAQRPAPSRAGTMVVGRSPLGRGCPDPALMLAHRSSTVTVTCELDGEQRQLLQPVIDRLLPVFVPAHCRLLVVYTGADSADRSRQLDVDLRLGPDDAAAESDPSQSLLDARLHGDAHWRLAATTRLGQWCLSEPSFPPAVLDHAAHLGAEPRLH